MRAPLSIKVYKGGLKDDSTERSWGEGETPKNADNRHREFLVDCDWRETSHTFLGRQKTAVLNRRIRKEYGDKGGRK